MNQRPITALIAAAFLLSTAISHAVNPDRSGPGGSCGTCEDCQGTASADPGESNLASVDLLLNLGRAPFARSNNFAGMFSEAGANVGNDRRPQGLDAIKGFFGKSPVANLWKAQLYLKSDTIDAAVFSPSALTYDATQKMEIRRDASGVIRQVLTHDFLVDIQSFTDFASSPKKEGYAAKWYFASDKGGISDGFYGIPSGISPVKTVTISNPTPQTYNTLDVFSTQETPGATARQILNRYIFGTDSQSRSVQRLQTWTTDSSGAPVAQIAENTLVYLSGLPTANAQTRIRTLSEAALSTTGTYGGLKIISRTREEYADVAGLKRLVSETVLNNETTETAGLTTTFGYYDGSDAFLHGRPQWQKNPDGSWTIWRIAGDTQGALITEITPFENTPYDANINPNLCRVKTRIIKGSWMETSVKVLGQLVEHEEEEFFNGANGEHILTTKRFYDATNFLTTITGHNAFGKNTDVGAGRIAWVLREDGTASLYSYGGSTTALVVTETTGPATSGGAKIPPSLIAGITQTVTTYNKFFHPIAEAVTALQSNKLLSSWDSTEQDLYGRPTLKTFDDGSTENSTYSCCGIASMTDRTGATTTYSRDLLKRVYSSTHKRSSSGSPITTTTAFDGLKSTIMRGDILSSETTRSLDGLTNTTLSPDADGDGNAETTSRATVLNAAGGRTTTTTYPDSTTTTTTNYRDGQTASTTDQEDHITTHTYGSHNVNGGGLWTRITAPNATQWTQTSTDLFGRTFRTDHPDGAFSSTTYHGSSAAIGARGKPATVKDADETAAPGTGSFTEYAYGYDAANHAFTTTTEHLSDNQTRVTTTTSDVVDSFTLHGVEFGPVLRSTTVVNGVTTSISYRSANGHNSGSTSFGRSTLNSSSIPANGAWTETSTTPAGQKTVHTHTDGLLKKTELFNNQGTAPANLIASTSYAHDALGRVLSSTDSRTGTTWFVGMTDHDNDPQTPLVRGTSVDTMASGSPRYIEDPGGRVTTFTYDSMGRVVQTTLPGSTIANPIATHNSYWPTGQIKASWGSQTYPTFRTYDSLDRLATLRTKPTLDANGVPTNAGGSISSWLYDSQRGWLVEKNHDGESGNGPGNAADYNYTLAGRQKTRTSERGVTATHTYDHGLLEDVTYTNDSTATPTVSRTYDSFGRLESLSNGLATSAFEYASDLSLDKETITYNLPGQSPFTRVLDRKPADLGRDTGWQLKDGTTIENQASYAYSATTGRLETIADSVDTFSYDFVTNSSLLKTVTKAASGGNPALVATRTYEPTRDTLAAIENKAGAIIRSSYDYTLVNGGVNSLGQRMGVQTTFNLGGAHTHNSGATSWGYDGLGQLTSANAPDLPGETETDPPAPFADRAYQYDTIGNRLFSEKGAPQIPATPGLNTTGYTPNALNQYDAITPYNASGVAGTPVEPVFDDDGNMKIGPLSGTGGSSANRLDWDAENRLVQVRAADDTTVITTTLYDAQFRRIATTAGGTTILYLYDGFNCIAEYTGTTLAKTRTWGIDLSGSMQGAGGVGGLLAEKQGTNSFYPTYDGNGNVSEYLEADGDVSAHFEYDPFGNIVKESYASGFDASSFTYKFSTKPLDLTTGLYYYTYRYYDPVTGRWPSRDPIGESGGLNLYGFVGNNGICRWDRLGQLGFDFSHSATLGGCIPIVPGVAFCVSGGWEVTNSPCCQDGQRKRLTETAGKIEASVVFGTFNPLYIDIKDDINLEFDPPPSCPTGSASPPDGCISFGFNAGMLNGECSWCIEKGFSCSFSWQMFPQANAYVQGSIKVRTHSIQ